MVFEREEKEKFRETYFVGGCPTWTAEGAYLTPMRQW
jgi:hypothetical protein